MNAVARYFAELPERGVVAVIDLFALGKDVLDLPPQFVVLIARFLGVDA